MAHIRGPGRIKIEIEGEGVTVLLRNGELRVIFTDGDGRTRIEKCRPVFVSVETWARDIEEEWSQE